MTCAHFAGRGPRIRGSRWRASADGLGDEVPENGEGDIGIEPGEAHSAEGLADVRLAEAAAAFQAVEGADEFGEEASNTLPALQTNAPLRDPSQSGGVLLGGGGWKRKSREAQTRYWAPFRSMVRMRA
jgi:hypothetical protein